MTGVTDVSATDCARKARQITAAAVASLPCLSSSGRVDACLCGQVG